MHIILGLAGLVATLVATRSHMPTGFTGFFHPAALILLLGAPPSILLVGHNISEIWRGIVTLTQALLHNARRAEARMIADLYRFGRELKQGRNVEASRALGEADDPLLREVGPLLLQPGGFVGSSTHSESPTRVTPEAPDVLRDEMDDVDEFAHRVHDKK